MAQTEKAAQGTYDNPLIVRESPTNIDRAMISNLSDDMVPGIMMVLKDLADKGIVADARYSPDEGRFFVEFYPDALATAREKQYGAMEYPVEAISLALLTHMNVYAQPEVNDAKHREFLMEDKERRENDRDPTPVRITGYADIQHDGQERAEHHLYVDGLNDIRAIRLKQAAQTGHLGPDVKVDMIDATHADIHGPRLAHDRGARDEFAALLASELHMNTDVLNVGG